MNRIDQLLAILLILQRKQLEHAQDLAQQPEISKWTIYRDMSALNQMGIPFASLPEEGFELITERDDFIYEGINGYLMFKVFKKSIWKLYWPLRKIAHKKNQGYYRGDGFKKFALAARDTHKEILSFPLSAQEMNLSIGQNIPLDA